MGFRFRFRAFQDRPQLPSRCSVGRRMQDRGGISTVRLNHAAMLNHVVREVYGPFHRKLAPNVQDAATVVKQIASGEIWGRPPSWGGSPAVKAYQGELPQGQSGI
jgi:hypothetical protein